MTWRLTRNLKRRGDNLSREEREALTQLQRCTDIVIKPADKGSATVVMSREAYIADAQRQLSNNRYYRKLDMDPTQHYAEQVKTLVHTIFNHGHIQKDTMKYLTPTHARTARFYHLPKIHKPGNPGRPIVSSCGAPTERISEL